MYRAYNGFLYGVGAAEGAKQKVHPEDRVRIEYDIAEGASVRVRVAARHGCGSSLIFSLLVPNSTQMYIELIAIQ